MKRSRHSPVVWLRRSLQLASLLAFCWLFLETAYHPINRMGSHVALFFQLDPLVLLTVWLGAHTVAAGLWLAMVTVAATLLLGRVFCGWVCPLGTVHTIVSALRGAKLKERRAVGGYSPWQRAKYLVLVAIVGAALCGINAAGWLDPLSLLYRSLATALYPASSSATRTAFTRLYEANPGIGPVRATAVSEPVYQVLRRHVLPLEQPHYAGGLVIGIIFFSLVALDLRRSRFWCRYLCPLGGLLGIVGTNPVLRVVRDRSSCDGCGICRAECHGGADPDGDWRPSECVYCCNCRARCPRQSIRIRLGLPPAPSPEGR